MPSRRLSKSDVEDIRLSSDPYRVLAQRYGVSQSLISLIRRNEIYRSQDEMFWSHLEITDSCWIWRGHISMHDGHPLGRFHFGGGAGRRSERAFAHRYMWELLRGEIPEGGYISHRCENTLCCNPTHLYIRYNEDLPKMHGEENGRARLTWEVVDQIRQARQDGYTYKQIAEEFGIPIGHAHGIVNLKFWHPDFDPRRHVD